MDRTHFFEWIDRHHKTFYLISAPGILILIGLVYLLVYQTGGVQFVYSHTMYIPILMAGFIFRIQGGVIAGLIAGIALGPIMPLNTVTGEMQDLINWLYRLVFFTGNGVFSGIAGDSARAFINHFRWLSQHDPITCLPNRGALFAQLPIEGRSKQPTNQALFLIDIENGLELSSTFGFGITDHLLPLLARRLSESQLALGVYQTGSRQLGLLVPLENQNPLGAAVALMEECQEAILFEDIPIHLDVRLGYTKIENNPSNPQEILQQAESALAQAGLRGVAHQPYEYEQTKTALYSIELLGELKNAILTGQVTLHYQPKVELCSGKVYGVEALMRWLHPERGVIPPGSFIPRAEQSTLIQLVTDFALEKALSQLATWHDQGIKLAMAVNISTRNLLQPGFTNMVLSTLERYGIPGSFLELEVTEGALMMDPEGTIGELKRLSEAQVVISIDDFGTGYSSLQYLHKLPVSLLKIDQSFIRRLPGDRSASYILDAATTLAHNMEIKTIAEGVESQEIYSYVAESGCDMAQGFAISHPLPGKEFAAWFTKYGGKWRFSEDSAGSF